MSTNKKLKVKLEQESLPKIILIKSNDTNIDGVSRSEEIRYYLAQIILLAYKRGRPSTENLLEVINAA